MVCSAKLVKVFEEAMMGGGISIWFVYIIFWKTLIHVNRM